MSETRGELSWSKSRDGTFSDCPRKYYYHYYGYWGGWSAEPASRLREIYLLRHLRSRYMWAGEVVHDTIEGILRQVHSGGEPSPLGQIQSAVRERMRAEFVASRERRFRREHKPTSVALHEHDYQRTVARDDWRALADQVDRCLESLFSTGIWRHLRQIDPGRDWLELEELRGFEVDGTRVHVRLDFACRDGDMVRIVDWKTGKSWSDNRLQFGAYALYMVRQHKLDPAQVTGLEVNLALGREREHRFSAADLAEVEDQIRVSVARMRELLRDPARNLAVEEDFPARPSARRCLGCNFYRICPEGTGLLGGPGAAPDRGTDRGA